MKSDSLPIAVTRWFGAVALLLYLAACAVIVAFEARNSRRALRILLYAESEALASYYAATGRLDFPELHGRDGATPLPVWVRIVEAGAVVAATPGLPELPLPAGEPTGSEGIEFLAHPAGTFAVVRHPVWGREEAVVEAFTSPEVLTRRRNDLLLALVLTGLILVPMAAAGGWILARRVSRPIAGLVDAVRRIDSENLGQRLAADAAPREVRALASEFNSLLARVEEAVERMRRFTADASHELRTPVSIMRTGIEVTLRRERPVAEYRAALEDLLQEIGRVQRTVEGLLALARDTSEYAATMPEELVELDVMIAEAVESLAPLSRERQVAIHQHLAPQLWVLGDPGYLRLLVLNLLDNALRHTPAGKNVRIDLSRVDGEKQARFLVRDEGPGIPAAEHPFIFERFYRGGGRRASRTGGLGLSVVRWVAERHEGRVGLVDDGEPGTTFEVVLPLADDLVPLRP